MNLRISRSGAIGLALTTLLAAALFMFLLARFGGPSVRLEQPYRVSAVVDDTRGLVTRSEVMVRGVRVGEVESVADAGDRLPLRAASP
jgi:ABC-type transporter Mla subunit MlaD